MSAISNSGGVGNAATIDLDEALEAAGYAFQQRMADHVLGRVDAMTRDGVEPVRIDHFFAQCVEDMEATRAEFVESLRAGIMNPAEVAN